MPKVSIIILTYNSSGYISKLLESIERFHKDLKNIEIIVVDNNSTDNTLDKLEKSRVNHQLREIPKNIGFSAGINNGSRNAKGEYLLFINPDTIFESGDIWEMINVFEKEKDVGIVGGKLINENGNLEKSSGKFYNLINTIFLALGVEELFGTRKSPIKLSKVDFVSGGFLMIKKSFFKKLGGFDNNFFMYVEDVDLCKRAKELGYATYFTPNTSLIHSSHGSSDRSFAIENIYKSIFYYHEKHSSKLTLILVKLILKLKAHILVIVGRMINNKYLSDTYKGALNI